ncbi:hypothetical protein HCH15_11310 [Corynebacterium testudinoris]|uniref:Uncharacterized protein n=1 Tax=Corynebacterium testudinoris TaxID=136857 RepID=A0A0G3H356_9CORY|nr:hypothetical protein [Corynebacterium testudinoris]AKK07834.1 hypothetical protein CTEST_01895 [Corynebacterium testudinoris]MBX8996759.1 hypothetical protein [Corynebacterium testudinoris]
MADKQTSNGPLIKALIVFFLGLANGIFLGLRYDSWPSFVGFLIVGFVVAWLVYMVGRRAEAR